jgi:hypothetical protein
VAKIIAMGTQIAGAQSHLAPNEFVLRQMMCIEGSIFQGNLNAGKRSPQSVLLHDLEDCA